MCCGVMSQSTGPSIPTMLNATPQERQGVCQEKCEWRYEA